jgi:diguanylate cyclase (GGDEF)-like protein
MQSHSEIDFVLPAVMRLMVFLYLSAFIGNYLNQLFHERGEELEKVANKLAELSLQLKELAITDGLTGLYNYRYFRQKLLDEVLRSKRYKRIVSIIMSDLDDFKCINDTYGHPMGDRILREVAIIFKTSVRAVDTVARYGGEEFALILPETDADGARLVSERVRSRIQQAEFPISPDDLRTLKTTVSSGVATFPNDATVPEALVEKADQALYVAKQRGKNRSCKYCEEFPQGS